MKVRAIRFFAAVLMAALLGGVSTDARASLVVDPFDDATAVWPLSLDTVGTAPDVIETGLASVLGGVRVTRLTAETLDLVRVDEVQVGVHAAPGIMSYSSSVLADGLVELFYIGEGGLDADLSGDTWLEIDLLAFDLAGGLPMAVTVNLWDGVNFAELAQDVVVSGRQLLQFPLASFAKLGSVDLTSVDLVYIGFDPGLGGDFRVGEITTGVPEPATLCLLLAGGFFAVRRRH